MKNINITSPYEACSIIGSFSGEDNTEEEQIAAFQYLIDTGIVWSLEGVYGRTAVDLINDGLCVPSRMAS